MRGTSVPWVQVKGAANLSGGLVGWREGKVVQTEGCLGGLCPGAAGDPENGSKGSWRGQVLGGICWWP